jgi:hypothetical protein
VIQQATGHRFHPGHTWKLLRRMGWLAYSFLRHCGLSLS